MQLVVVMAGSFSFFVNFSSLSTAFTLSAINYLNFKGLKFFRVLKTFSFLPHFAVCLWKTSSCTKKNLRDSYAAKFAALCHFCNFVANVRIFSDICKKNGNYFSKKMRNCLGFDYRRKCSRSAESKQVSLCLAYPHFCTFAVLQTWHKGL